MENDASDLGGIHFQVPHALVDIWPKFHRFSQNTVTVVEQNTARGSGCDDGASSMEGKMY